MSQSVKVSSLATFSNNQLLTQIMKNCGLIPESFKGDFSNDDFLKYEFTRNLQFAFETIMKLPVKEFEEDFEELNKELFPELSNEPFGTRYLISKRYPYLVCKVDGFLGDDDFGSTNYHKDFLKTSKGPHNEYIIEDDKYFSGLATYEIAAKQFLPSRPDEDDEGTPHDILIFKDGNHYRWDLGNLAWASVVNEFPDHCQPKTFVIGRIGNIEIDKSYVWDLENHKVAQIKNDLVVPLLVKQNKYSTEVCIKDVKGKFRVFNLKKTIETLKKREEAYLNKLSKNKITKE